MTKDCTAGESEYVCLVCPNSANHSTLDRECPTYLNQKEICTVMATENIPFMAAKAKVTPAAPSFAAVAKKGIQANVGNDLSCQCKCNCIETQIKTPSSIDRIIMPRVVPDEVTVPAQPVIPVSIPVVSSQPDTSMPVVSTLHAPAYRSAVGADSEAEPMDTFVDADDKAIPNDNMLHTPNRNTNEITNQNNYKRELSFSGESPVLTRKNPKNANDGSALC